MITKEVYEKMNELNVLFLRILEVENKKSVKVRK